MLTKKRLPLLIAVIFLIVTAIFLWAEWTTTFNPNNFFAIKPEYVFDKCARTAGRLSSILILVILITIGHLGLKKIYSDEKKRDSFLILITLFTINHLIHLLFVFLRFRTHNVSISLGGPITVGGTLHGIITFTLIVLIPMILWNYKSLNKLLYFGIILHLFNITLFINKTFMSRVNPPIYSAYHNQFGILALSAACLYVLYRVYFENIRNEATI